MAPFHRLRWSAFIFDGTANALYLVVLNMFFTLNRATLQLNMF